MKQTIDIELFKENPEFFFSQLPEQAEKEFQSLLEFMLFKYNLTNSYQNKDIKINKFSLFKENPIKVEKIKKYSREELHEKELKVFKIIPEGILNPININNFIHYTREELHDR